MTTTRRTFRSVALAAIAGLALSACSLGVGGPSGAGNVENSGSTETTSEGSQSGEQKDSSKDEGGDATKEDASNKEADAGNGGTNTVEKPSQVLATWEGKAPDGAAGRFEINEVLVSDGMTRLTFTMTNTGQTEWEEGGILGVRELLRDEIQLVDSKNHLIYKPGKTEDGECLCTNLKTRPALPAGESLTLYTTFKALPEGVDTVSVNMSGAITQPFENVKVTRK
ncbi:MAG: hypothetical protein Q4C87_12405 [Actinomycetaceae bacterium]|nr:hypothetical protein [Actinomycetaceae bacterium]